MSTFTKEQYLQLVRQLTEQQYDELGDEEEEYVEWAPSEPEIKRELVKARSNAITDLTHAKKDQLADLIYKTTNLKIHNFTIKISTYHGNPDENENLTVDFTLYHEVYKTPSLQAPCKMTYSCNVFKDTRFAGRSWLKYFDTATGSHGIKVSTSTLIDIIRWIQIVVKYPAFL